MLFKSFFKGFIQNPLGTHFNFNKLVNFPTWHFGKLRKNLKICAAARIFSSILNFANRYYHSQSWHHYFFIKLSGKRPNFFFSYHFFFLLTISDIWVVCHKQWRSSSLSVTYPENLRNNFGEVSSRQELLLKPFLKANKSLTKSAR